MRRNELLRELTRYCGFQREAAIALISRHSSLLCLPISIEVLTTRVIAAERKLRNMSVDDDFPLEELEESKNV